LRTSHDSPAFLQIFYPFGFPVEVGSNSPLVLDAARAEWSEWKQAFDDSPVRLGFCVGDDGTELIPSTFQSHTNTFSIAAGPGNYASGDTRAQTASATLTRNAAADRAYLVYHFLDAMAGALITAAHFTPLHAGCVAHNGSGVLLCGDSHSGKSTLAYACARAGWTFVGIRSRPDARDLFPELARFKLKLRGNGKVSLQIPTRELQIATAARTRVDSMVLLRRAPSGVAQLLPMEKDQVREHCEKWFAHWDAEVYAEQVAAFESFLSGVCSYSLEYSDVDAAVAVLNDAV
jgi:hypothetical protein